MAKKPARASKIFKGGRDGSLELYLWLLRTAFQIPGKLGPQEVPQFVLLSGRKAWTYVYNASETLIVTENSTIIAPHLTSRRHLNSPSFTWAAKYNGAIPDGSAG